jgi:hypothetical protein
MKLNPKKASKSSRPNSRPRRRRFNSHELALQPWFLPRANRLAINSLIPADYRNKMRAYFEDYGCMICGKHKLYESNGMCLPCHHLIRRRLKTSIRRRMVGRADDRLDLIMKRRKELASKLLGRFSQSWSKMSLAHRLNATCQRNPAASLRNPVDEALGYLTPGSWRNRYRKHQDDSQDERGVLGKSVHDLPKRTRGK